MDRATTENRRILVVDADRIVHADFEAILTKNPLIAFDVDSASQGDEALAMLTAALERDEPYAVAFVGLRMQSGWDGMETIMKLWEVDARLQVVICTSQADYSWEEIVLRLGVSDRLLLLRRPFDAAEVCQVACALAEKWHLARQAQLKLWELRSMVEERTHSLKEANLQLQHDAFHDSLTGLPNRMQLTERIERCLARQKQQPTYRFAVMFIDLDHFKVINDSLGHLVGDELLVEISTRFSSWLCDSEPLSGAESYVLARLGGDEFVVLLEGIEEDADVLRAGERFLESVREPVVVSGREIRVSLSLGIAIGSDAYARPEDVLRDADTALYRAKADGRARFRVFTDQMHTAAVSRWQTENELRHAIAAGELFVQYQPVVDLASGEIVHFEALVRWRHPRRGFVSPAEFIPLAEETGLIVPLGRWVLEEACRQVVSWNACLLPGRQVAVAVNVAAKQFARPTFAAEVQAVLAATGADARSLKLELTESALMEASAINMCSRLRELGIQIQLDDFGTGYSSLSYLHRLPIDALKIDRSFVSTITHNAVNAAIVRAILALAGALAIEVIGEGVETAAELELLCEMGCALGQGYFWAKPLDPAQAFDRLDIDERVQRLAS